jgi:hypothetical protein
MRRAASVNAVWETRARTARPNGRGFETRARQHRRHLHRPDIARQGRQETHKYIFWQESKRAVRMDHWKGIGMPGVVKLYDLSKDFGEKNNPLVGVNTYDFARL